MIYNWLSNLLIVLTIIWVIYTIVLLRGDADLGIAFGFSGVLIVGMFGWFFMGNIYPILKFNREMSAQVLKTDKSIILIINGQPVQTLTDIFHYKYFENKTNSILIQSGYVNIYETTNWGNSYTIKE